MIRYDELQALGFDVTVTSTMIEALAKAQELLNPDLPQRPTLILIDCASVQPDQPNLEGTNGAAVLSRMMQEGRIHVAVMVAISSFPTAEREIEAVAAGCIAPVLKKPLIEPQAVWLRGLVAQPIVVPHTDVRPDNAVFMHAYQQFSERVLRSTTTVPVPFIWTEARAYILLAALTKFTLRKYRPESVPQRVTDSPDLPVMLQMLGGPEGARAYLAGAATTLPKHSKTVLTRLLAGHEPKDIIKDGARGFSLAHVYRLMINLPGDIADYGNAHLRQSTMTPTTSDDDNPDGVPQPTQDP